MFASNRTVDRVCLVASIALMAFFALVAPAFSQCNPGPVFDPANLNLGASLGAGNCPGGNCQRQFPPAQNLSVPDAGGAAAAASANTAMGGSSELQQLQATMAQLNARINALTSGGSYAAANGSGYKPLRMAQHGAASAASAASTGGYEPLPNIAQPLANAPLAAPTIPVALAGTSSASSASTVAANNGCNGGRGFFRRASRTRTRTTTNANGNRSTSTATSVSRG